MVNHALMYRVLEKFGVPVNFMNFLKSFYKNCKSIIQNKGFFSKEVSIRRGVRQGCPLSFFLYIMVAEILSIIIQKEKRIMEYPFPWPALSDIQVKISMYTDDTITPLAKLGSMRTTKQNLLMLNDKLLEFQEATGSKLNMDKSKIFVFGGKNPEENL